MNEFDFRGKDLSNAYHILTTLVTPRPIALISTVGESGVVNVAPFSFFNVFGSKPPLVAVSIGNRGGGMPKDTARNIMEQGEFVIHMVDEAIAEGMVRTADALPAEQSEVEHAGWTTTPSKTVKPPRIIEAPAVLECVKHSVIQIGQNRMILGLVQYVHAEEGILDPESGMAIQPSSYFPIGRMQSPDCYNRTHARFHQG